MKTYFSLICNFRNACAAFIVMMACGCHPGFIAPHSVDVYVKKSVRPFYKTATLAILPFETAEMPPDFGMEVARIFEGEMNKTGYVRSVIFTGDYPWMKQITEQDSKLRKALLAAREQKADLALWGTVEKFIPGAAGDTTVRLNVKLINLGTGNVLWWGKETAVGKPGNTFLFFGQRLSPDPPDVERLFAHAAHKIVSDMFPAVEPTKTIGFPGRLWAGITGAKKKPAAAHEEAADVKETALAPDDGAAEPSQPAVTRAAPASHEKDIIDKIIEELDADY